MLTLKEIVKQPITLYDVETNGLNLQYSIPWQFSWLQINNGKIESENDMFPWYADLKVSEEAARVNRFDHDTYKSKATDKKIVCKKFYEDVKGRWRCGHNIINFDVYMENKLRKDCGLNEDYSFMDKVIDTRALAVAMQLGITKIDYENFTAWQYSMLSIRKRGLKSSLEFLLKEFEIPYESHKLHDGLYDIQKNADLLWKIAYKFD